MGGNCAKAAFMRERKASPLPSSVFMVVLLMISEGVVLAGVRRDLVNFQRELSDVVREVSLSFQVCDLKLDISSWRCFVKEVSWDITRVERVNW
jgi:hypothetical protein